MKSEFSLVLWVIYALSFVIGSFSLYHDYLVMHTLPANAPLATSDVPSFRTDDYRDTCYMGAALDFNDAQGNTKYSVQLLKNRIIFDDIVTK